jgi:hypothetical protein
MFPVLDCRVDSGILPSPYELTQRATARHRVDSLDYNWVLRTTPKPEEFCHAKELLSFILCNGTISLEKYARSRQEQDWDDDEWQD